MMRPDFALSLSFEGIRLLQRTSRGWVSLGDVALDSPDLAGDLAALRRKGEAAAGGPLRCRIVLPDDQIRYLVLDDPQAGPEAARAALDGLTPYALDDLAVDHVSAGGRTHVAAVALETLEEARVFAAEHGFGPVAYVAWPGGDAFGGQEVLFGPVPGAETVARDARLPLLPAGAPADAAQGPAGAQAAEAGAKPGLPGRAAEPGAAGAGAPALADAADAGPPPVAEPAAGTPPPDTEPQGPQPEAPSPGGLTTDRAPAADQSPPRDRPLKAPEPEPVFASRSRPRQHPKAGGPADTDKPAGKAAAVTGGDRPEAAAAGKAPSAARWVLHADAPRGKTAAVLPPRPPRPARDGGSAGAKIVPLSRTADTARDRPVSAISSASGSVSGAPAASGTGGTGSPSAAPPQGTRPAAGPQGMAPAGGRPAEPRRSSIAPPPASMAPAPPAGDPERLTIFGARKRSTVPPVRGKPRHLGLILTLILLIVMAAVGVLAATSPSGLAGLLGRGSPAVETASVSPALPAMAVDQPLAPAGTDGQDASADPEPDEQALHAAADAVARAMAGLALQDTPAGSEAMPRAVTASPRSVVTAAEAERFYAATGVWLRSERLAVTPRTEAPPSLPAALGTRPDAPQPPALAAPASDPAMLPPADPPPAGTRLPRDERGLIAATPEGTLSPDGILLIAGTPPVRPPTRPGTAGPTTEADPGPADPMTAPPAVAPPSRPAEEVGDGTGASAMAFVDPSLAPMPGAVGLGGLVTDPLVTDPAASPAEDAMLLAAFDGPRPSPRPEGLAPDAPVVADVFDGPRPAPRPDAIEQAATATAAATADTDAAVAAALAAPEPAPESPPPPAPAAAPDLQSTLAAIVQGAPDPLAGATPQAVARARVPDARPRHFDRVVADQLARLARAQQPSPQVPAQTAAAGAAGGVGLQGLQPNEIAESEPEPASSAAAAPSGPVTATVAQAATFQDVMQMRQINLIGIFGTPNDRRALVRLGNGRLVRVSVGDQLDGGQVTAIGDNALNIARRGGRTETLVIPGR